MPMNDADDAGDDRTAGASEGGQPDDEAGRSEPGCGLGIYALLLLGLGTAGLVGLIIATAALLQGDGTSPMELVSGKAVPTWRLAPMIQAGVLKVDEIPLAWHDESSLADGTRACALLPEAVVRVDEGAGKRIPYTTITEARMDGLPDGSQVVLVSDGSADLACLFKPGEGAIRFLRQVQAEQLKAERARAE